MSKCPLTNSECNMCDCKFSVRRKYIFSDGIIYKRICGIENLIQGMITTEINYSDTKMPLDWEYDTIVDK